ncbi:hypothetical protein [Parvularcula sp. LCG005]|uniref:hypothetical protein n=1 Tax=Parvularcula sp. LCG005 TaxID=3078805 RepID=UPI0029438629|nr:hypothetical protein [Parvularcula sp. LCG005]WOI52080.1 hypothetical protein RUI03_07910 [Parvularcula sp. LCG005]
MHIIMGLIIALGGVLWAVKHLMEGAHEARGAARRLTWQHRSGKSRLDAIEDPRESAAILFVQSLRYVGEINAAERAKLTGFLSEKMGLSHAEAEELVSYAIYATLEQHDAANHLSRLLKPVQANCTVTERHELIDMLSELIAPESDGADQQRALVARVKDRLLS